MGTAKPPSYEDIFGTGGTAFLSSAESFSGVSDSTGPSVSLTTVPPLPTADSISEAGASADIVLVRPASSNISSENTSTAVPTSSQPSITISPPIDDDAQACSVTAQHSSGEDEGVPVEVVDPPPPYQN